MCKFLSSDKVVTSEAENPEMIVTVGVRRSSLNAFFDSVKKSVDRRVTIEGD